MIFNGHKLTKRKDGRWQCKLTINKKQKYIYGKTQTDCIKNIKKVGKTYITTEKALTGLSIVEKLYSTIKEPNLKEKTKDVYKNTLNNYIKPFLKEKDINQIQLFELQQFLNSIQKERTREQIYQHIKGIFKYATACGELKNNIAEALILPKRQNKITRESLTIAEQQKLLEAIKEMTWSHS